MILNFGDYIFNDGINSIDGEKSKMINVVANSTKMQGTKAIVNNGNIDVYQQYAFNENYFNNLINQGKIQDAVDYASRYRPVDNDKRREFDANLASLRQQAKYENNFKSNLTEDQRNRYNFYNGVFEDRGLDSMKDNPYVKEFEKLKRNIGSVTTFDKDGNLVIDKEATGLGFWFPNGKRVSRFVPKGNILEDALAADGHASIDDFLAANNLTKNELMDAGIKIQYDDTGSAYIKFDKSNKLANSLIYKYIDFYSNNWNDNTYRPSIQGLDSDGNVINEAIIPFKSEFSGTLAGKLFRKFYKGYFPSNNDIKVSQEFNSFKSLIDENKNISAELEKLYEVDSRDYSSIESSFVSDEMQNYLNEARSKGLTESEIRSGMEYIHKQDVELATKSLSQADKEFYTSYFNDNENDDTLVQTEDPEQIEQIVDLLNAADPNDVNLSILVANGVIGTKISLQRKEEKKGETILGSNKGLQVWIPGLFTEQAQQRLNREPESRAVLEVNTILDTNDTYTLHDGSRIKADGNSQFYIERGRFDENGRAGFLKNNAISKEDAILEITKDIMLDDAIHTQFNEQISPSGDVIDINAYDNAAKEKAFEIAQKLYPGQDDIVKPDGTPVSLEEVFTKQITPHNVSPYVYAKVKTIYDIYEALMSELYSYGGFQDALLNIGQTRYNYSINS